MSAAPATKLRAASLRKIEHRRKDLVGRLELRNQIDRIRLSDHNTITRNKERPRHETKLNGLNLLDNDDEAIQRADDASSRGRYGERGR